MTRRSASVVCALVVAVAAVGCGGRGPADPTAASAPAGAGPSTSVAPPTSLAPSTTSAPPPTSAPSTTPAPAPPAAFRSSVAPIDDALAARMSASWRPGCPVPLTALRYVRVGHWGEDGAVHDGELVVHESAVEAIISVFSTLFDARFPIHSMRLVDDFGADDQASMRANNTSAFNCREVNGRPGVLSNHSWGTAIDINPLVNPWVSGSFVDPPEGAPYADRTRPVPGMIVPGDVVVRAFTAVGWGWGGAWPSSKDWQHFSASGN